jgi:Tol biopolymer transport system component
MVRITAAGLVSVLLVLIVPEAAHAQYFGRNKVHYDRLDFRLLQTDHFDIYYYAEEEAATRHAARMAERWYVRFSRLFDHKFEKRQPLVLYASHPHFAQTNLTAGSPGEGTGGFTERNKSRIAMPFAPGLGETDHVLGHEIAHAFQIDIAKSVKQNAFTLPGWFIEGMAEYLSLGGANAHTLMWIRDAARHDRLPTLADLDGPLYFPYRYGHALWSYLAGRFGDGVMGRVLRSRARGGVVKRLEEITGLTADVIASDWHASIGATATPAAGEPKARADEQRGRMQLGPALSPDGRHLMFLSERDRLSVDLFMADAASGRIERKIVSAAAERHFDSLQYIDSSGSWDAKGERFAFAALTGGDPVLVVVDVATGDREEIPLSGVREIFNPSWSPDGQKIVVSGLKGGLSDLFIYSFETRSLTQLTADAYADLQPAWSPDGRTIALATDRFTTTLDDLRFGALRVGMLDLATGVVRPLDTTRTAGAMWPAPAKQINPQWAPDGGAVYFVSDRDGTSNVFRADVASGLVRQVTDVHSGVSGITAASPALAVASQAGTIAYSAYENGRYAIHVSSDCEPCALLTSDATDESAASPESQPPDGTDDAVTLAEALADASTGLPPAAEFPTREYDDRLRLESLAQPFIGGGTGSAFGGPIRASFGVTFSDMLRDRQLQTFVRLGIDIDDLAAQAAYTNRAGQWNYGVTAGFLPARFYGARRAIVRDEVSLTRETTSLRYLHQWGGLIAHYHVNRAQRIELGGGVRRTGFAWQTLRRVIDDDNNTISRTLDEASAGRPIYLAETQLAFVHDTAITGPTGPVLGQRLRVDVEPSFGVLRFADVRIDARRYFMPIRPITVAARIQHVGRYGSGAADSRLTPLVVGLQTLVRGYDLQSFASGECGRTATECSLLDQLTGSRFGLMNLEVRAPLLGLLTGQLDYGHVPIEVLAFVDTGFLWTRQSAGPLERDRFRSVGAGGRANLGGLVLEMTAARPFDGPQRGWTVSFLLRPGW